MSGGPGRGVGAGAVATALVFDGVGPEGADGPPHAARTSALKALAGRAPRKVRISIWGVPLSVEQFRGVMDRGRYDREIMSEDDAPKSSLELAMARLRKKDAESGDTIRELSAGQKEEIAEIRRVYDAKMAEVDIMKRPKLPPGLPEELREQVDLLNEQYLRERDLLAAERDAKIEAVRSGAAKS